MVFRVGEGLTMTDDVLSADKQFNYTAGANISISNTGVISLQLEAERAAASVKNMWDQKMSEAYQNAQAYTDSKIPNVSFEKVGEV